MSTRKELSRARKAVARGRGDEALVILWNLVEQARLEDDRRTLRAIGELAAAVARTDEGSRREAERLLETLGRTGPARAEPAAAGPPSPAPEEPTRDDAPVLEDWKPEESELPTEDGFEPADVADAETESRRRSRARYVIPVVTAAAILLNLIVRAFGDD